MLVNRSQPLYFSTRAKEIANEASSLPCGVNFADRYIEMRMRRVHLTIRTEGTTAFSNRYGVEVWMGENDTKTISVDANLFENGLMSTGPKMLTQTFSTRK